MKHQKLIISLLLFLFFLPLQAYAEEIHTGFYIGTKDGNPTPIVQACSQSNECTYTRVKVGGIGVGGRIDLVFLDGNSNFVGDFTGTITEDTWSFDVTPPPNAYRMRIGIQGGQEAFLMEAVNSKEPNKTYIYTYDAPPPPSGGSDGGSGGCDMCSLFECPNWGQYMGKLDEIKGAIPPPPNWSQVAETFRGAIVPSLVSEVGNMLGSAPTPQQPPNNLQTIDTTQNTPQMQTVPNLSDSGFDKDKLTSEAPVIEFREDPTGGFEISNPVDSLPDFPNGGEFPEPGKTDPGEWGEHKPKEIEKEIPFPTDSGEVDLGETPTPENNTGAPPTPDEQQEGAPMPDGGFSPPTPSGGGGFDGTTKYKKHPDDPDGSG